MGKAGRPDSYRIPMQVRKVRIIGTDQLGNCYPVCPKCGLTMDREYQSYCDRCGQALTWRNYKNAIVIQN